MREEIVRKTWEAGIVGAGGAGFPTHVKINTSVDTVIANIAECEPLLHKDKEISKKYPREVITGLEAVMTVTGSREGIVAIKEKNSKTINSIEQNIKEGISLFPLGDYYPAGDEIVLTFDVTRKIIPEGKIPIDSGILVSNAETLYNITRALDSQPVIEKFVTVTGMVKNPCTLKVPIGTTVKELLESLNIVFVNRAIFMDGLMMGELISDLESSITKKTSCIILLPLDHPLVMKRRKSLSCDVRIVKSACDQCSYCTEFCPRYLLGHSVEPHRVMRSLSVSHNGTGTSLFAHGCVDCGLCSLFACPESLSPDTIMKLAKDTPQEGGKVTSSKGVHPMREFRKVPLTKLVKRLSVEKYDRPAPLTDKTVEPKEVRIPLLQHIGKPASPIKSPGDSVRKGDLIGEVDIAETGARIHASIKGKIKEVNGKEIVIGKGT
jgi:Na+-translocating ferredoxin:NAD+ oxidoreductase RnfC subunit